MKPTKSGVVAALNHRGFSQDTGPFPPALKAVPAALHFTANELDWADYLINDTDFGGAWNDSSQINMHLEAR